MHERRTIKRRRLQNWIWFSVAVISSWIGLLLIDGGLIWFAFWAVILFGLWRRKFRLFWLLLIFSSWSLFASLAFLGAVKDYCKGEAHFEYEGLISCTGFDLDREFRVAGSTSGCIVFGPEIFSHAVNNWTVRNLIRVFGMQRGAYRGFYPEDGAAERIVDSCGQRVDVERIGNRTVFNLAQQRYDIDAGGWGCMEDFDSAAVVRVAVWDKELVILRQEDGKGRMTCLAERRSGKVFARYFRVNTER